MTVSVVTDAEADRVLSLRASARTPLPPEISMMPPEKADLFFRRRAYYGLMGVDSHPLVRFLEGADISAGMAETLARASHLDRVSHYSAWCGSSSSVRMYVSDGESETEVREGRSRPPSQSAPRQQPPRRRRGPPLSDAGEP